MTVRPCTDMPSHRVRPVRPGHREKAEAILRPDLPSASAFDSGCRNCFALMACRKYCRASQQSATCALQCDTSMPSFPSPEGAREKSPLVVLRLLTLHTIKTHSALQRLLRNAFHQPVSDDVYPASKSPSGRADGRGTPEGTGVRSCRCRDAPSGPTRSQMTERKVCPEGVDFACREPGLLRGRRRAPLTRSRKGRVHMKTTLRRTEPFTARAYILK